jgi:hypothetical protein
MFIVLFSILLIPLAYGEGNGDPFLGALPLIFTAFSLTVFMIAIAYMLSKAFQNVAYEVWAKDELAHLGLSCALIFCVFGAFQIGNSIAQSYATGLGANTFEVAYNYLDKLVVTDGLDIVRGLTYGSLNDQFAATSYLFIGWPIIGGGGVSPHANKKTWSQQKELLIDIFMPAIISLRVQKMLLNMIEIFGVSVLLPIALVLRVFPFTRDIGNFLIALSFGLFIVLPLTYVLNAKASNEIDTGGGTVIVDKVIGSDALSSIGKIIPQAVLLPNISIVIVVTFVQALGKAMRVFAA